MGTGLKLRSWGSSGGAEFGEGTKCIGLGVSTNE